MPVLDLSDDECRLLLAMVDLGAAVLLGNPPHRPSIDFAEGVPREVRDGLGEKLRPHEALMADAGEGLE